MPLYWDIQRSPIGGTPPNRLAAANATEYVINSREELARWAACDP